MRETGEKLNCNRRIAISDKRIVCDWAVEVKIGRKGAGLKEQQKSGAARVRSALA
jgi:hypothetical protein